MSAPMDAGRRHLLLAGCALVWAGGGAAADTPLLPWAVSLKDELAAALRRGKVLVVMVSLEGCPFCRQVRDSHLVHLRREGQPIVEVDIQRPLPLAGFDGRATTHVAIAEQWKAKVAPTLLFFGPGGREVAPRLVGAGIPDFYGAYLEQRLATANLQAVSPGR
jgi:hypothetical protein